MSLLVYVFFFILIASVYSDVSLLYKKEDNGNYTATCVLTGDHANFAITWDEDNFQSIKRNNNDWNIFFDNWEKVNSLEYNNLSLIMDERWEDFVINDAETIMNTTITSYAPLSIYTKTPVDINFCSKANTCVKLELDRNSNVTFNSFPTNIDSNLNYGEWNHFKFSTINNKIAMNDKVIGTVGKIDYFQISGDYTFWKLHNYDFYKVNKPLTKIRTVEEQGLFCIVFFVKMCDSCKMYLQMDNDIDTKVHIKGSNNWEKHIFKVNILRSGNKTLLIETISMPFQNSFWYMSNIRRCIKSEKTSVKTRVSTITTKKMDNLSCQSIYNQNKATLKMDQRSREECSENHLGQDCKIKCENIFETNSSCNALRICDDKHGCFCSKNYFGVDCVKKRTEPIKAITEHSVYSWQKGEKGKVSLRWKTHGSVTYCKLILKNYFNESIDSKTVDTKCKLWPNYNCADFIFDTTKIKLFSIEIIPTFDNGLIQSAERLENISLEERASEAPENLTHRYDPDKGLELFWNYPFLPNGEIKYFSITKNIVHSEFENKHTETYRYDVKREPKFSYKIPFTKSTTYNISVVAVNEFNNSNDMKTSSIEVIIPPAKPSLGGKYPSIISCSDCSCRLQIPAAQNYNVNSSLYIKVQSSNCEHPNYTLIDGWCEKEIDVSLNTTAEIDVEIPRDVNNCSTTSICVKLLNRYKSKTSTQEYYLEHKVEVIKKLEDLMKPILNGEPAIKSCTGCSCNISIPPVNNIRNDSTYYMITKTKINSSKCELNIGPSQLTAIPANSTLRQGECSARKIFLNRMNSTIVKSYENIDSDVDIDCEAMSHYIVLINIQNGKYVSNTYNLYYQKSEILSFIYIVIASCIGIFLIIIINFIIWYCWRCKRKVKDRNCLNENVSYVYRRSRKTIDSASYHEYEPINESDAVTIQLPPRNTKLPHDILPDTGYIPKRCIQQFEFSKIRHYDDYLEPSVRQSPEYTVLDPFVPSPNP